MIENLAVAEKFERFPVPEYQFHDGRKIALALKSFDRHMTDEGHQLQRGWQRGGVELWGRGYHGVFDCVDAKTIVAKTSPSLCIVQDRREWDRKRPGCLDRNAGFKNTHCLRGCSGIFRMTVLKDSHQDPAWTHGSHEFLQPHAWFIYYHPSIICHLASWLRPEHCIRVFHTVDQYAVPDYSNDRAGILLSGAITPQVYPLRWALRSHWRKNGRELSGVTVMSHPGYNAKGHKTPSFLRELSRFKVSICTTSIYGYALRKIIEAVACGCVPITDLPVDDVLPEIDAALVRIPVGTKPAGVFDLCRQVELEYDADKAEHFSKKALEFYDWRASGLRQIEAVEQLQRNYR